MTENMKKYISLAMSLLAMMAFTACTIEEGTTPGGDSAPYVNVMKYEVAAPLNPDNDVKVRIVANNQASDVYYLAEKTAEKDARGLSAEAYADYVVSNGTKAAMESDLQSGGKVLDLTLTNLFGEYTITAVAANGGTKNSSSTVFTGLDWKTICEGTYQFGNANVQFLLGGITMNPTTLQVCTTDETLYRFKDVFGEGNHMKINLLPKYKATDDDGTYTFFRVKDQKLGVQYNGNDVYIRDIGYWQGDDAYVTDHGYESGMYEDYTCFLYLQCHIGSTNYGYKYDYFIPE